ncbi:hypothetical protein MLD38_039381 [Melastoma candidum]|uniref:Uncharacterized protein n=1 Tax=Melastoma candidum TaxID=119954 RepID=A0ACB9L331_9MYRT|nr:hypothetical protein MLD38_039381 [Melastoma candidum]
MDRLGMFREEYAQEGDDQFANVWGGNIGEEELVGLLEEEDVCLEEVKEAFHVFNGRINAGEPGEVIQALGMANVGERECRELMRNFDEDGDEFIDFREFTKLVEKSLRS